jgi:hypothetical protein
MIPLSGRAELCMCFRLRRALPTWKLIWARRSRSISGKRLDSELRLSWPRISMVWPLHPVSVNVPQIPSRADVKKAITKPAGTLASEVRDAVQTQAATEAWFSPKERQADCRSPIVRQHVLLGRPICRPTSRVFCLGSCELWKRKAAGVRYRYF